MLASPNSNQATIRQDDHPESLGDQQQLGIRVTEVFGKPAALHDAAAIAKSLDPNVLRRGEPKSSWTYLDPKIITCHKSIFKKTILMRIAYYIYIYICVCVCFICVIKKKYTIYVYTYIMYTRTPKTLKTIRQAANSPSSTRLFRIHTTSSGALSASSMTSTRPWRTAETRGESW